VIAALGYLMSHTIGNDSPSTTSRAASTVICMLAAVTMTLAAVSIGIVVAVITAIKLGLGRNAEPAQASIIVLEVRQSPDEQH
jgi:MFS superfamily sulfate permease-like transporter